LFDRLVVYELELAVFVFDSTADQVGPFNIEYAGQAAVVDHEGPGDLAGHDDLNAAGSETDINDLTFAEHKSNLLSENPDAGPATRGTLLQRQNGLFETDRESAISISGWLVSNPDFSSRIRVMITACAGCFHVKILGRA
jgi:hypothetical protein